MDSLLAPESPVQFYAQFSERLFTEATVPATSHYKVYYHIYAGNDRGAQYSVYLKNPPASSYYRVNPMVVIETGYIGKGDSVDKSIDRTAPQGYKELCVSVNAQEWCGFKQVSTNFGLEYVQKKYVEDQASTTGITSEKDCISGTKSAWGLANTNIQAGAEEAVQPNIALRGIVRICASHNPDAGVYSEVEKECVEDNDCGGSGERCSDGKCYDSSGSLMSEGNTRWVDVGYCGDANVRCWLDKRSVENDLKIIESVENKSISVLEEDAQRLEGTAMTYEDVRKSINSLNKDIGKLTVTLSKKNLQENSGYLRVYIEEAVRGPIIGLSMIIDPVEGGGPTDLDKAEALSMKAEVYRLVVESLERFGVKKVTKKEIDDRKAGEAVFGEASCNNGMVEGDEECDGDDGYCYDSLRPSGDEYGYCSDECECVYEGDGFSYGGEGQVCGEGLGICRDGCLDGEIGGYSDCSEELLCCYEDEGIIPDKYTWRGDGGIYDEGEYIGLDLIERSDSKYTISMVDSEKWGVLFWGGFTAIGLITSQGIISFDIGEDWPESLKEFASDLESYYVFEDGRFIES